MLTVWKALFMLRYTQPKKTELPNFGAYILEDGFSTKYEARLVVLQLLHGSESPPGLVKIQIFWAPSSVSDSGGLEQGLRIFFSNMLWCWRRLFESP